MNNDRQMNDHPRNQEEGAHSSEAADGRRPYSPPTLTRHEKLPVITAGSISEKAWNFQEERPD